MKKSVCYSEIAYVLGLVLSALGVAFMARSDFGVSVVVAPAYVLYRRLSLTFGAFTFGMAEYSFQAVLLLLLIILLRRFRVSFLFSFLTAVLYGFILDGCMALVSRLPASSLWQCILHYVAGLLLIAAGIAMMFHTYLSPEVYELFVKEAADAYGWKISTVKTVYDCASCALALCMSFVFFGLGTFTGIGPGTVLCALVNGKVIGAFSAFYDARLEFRDGLKLRRFFA